MICFSTVEYFHISQILRLQVTDQTRPVVQNSACRSKGYEVRFSNPIPLTFEKTYVGRYLGVKENWWLFISNNVLKVVYNGQRLLLSSVVGYDHRVGWKLGYD